MAVDFTLSESQRELQKNAKASCYLVKRPKALQWFHNGRLCKEHDEERQAGRFELFLDLLCKFCFWGSLNSYFYFTLLSDSLPPFSNGNDRV